MKKYFIQILLSAILFGFLIFPIFAFAKTDLSIADTDITLSSENIVEGQVVRVYARIFNNGTTDVYGFVMFYGNNKELGQPQPISVRANNYDDVFIDWTAMAGTFNIQAKIINTNLTDENLSNNTVDKKNIIVEKDVNKNGIADNQEKLASNATNTTNKNSTEISSQTNSSDQNNGVLSLVDNAIKSVESVFNSKDANNPANTKQAQNITKQNQTGWIMSLQNYLDTASQKVKNNPNYNKYLLPGLLILFVLILFLFRKRR